MAVTLYATRDDVRGAFEGTIPDDAKNNTRLDGLLTRASAKLIRLVPSLDIRMGSGEIPPEVPEGMVVEAVLRVWRNPAGFTQQGVGPFQGSFSKLAATNEIQFDPAEITNLEGGVVPSSFRVAYPGRRSPVDGLLDAERALNIVVHPAGL